ncbi:MULTISPECIES: acetolactate synthase 2 small subunit [Pseudoalteromonas]|jgi:acetolactate synthase II small subunit|uniref:Acetolactate synthase n=2 Tax=Pseudoalteromonas TaxID=53246 RepID=A0A0F4QIF7_9GAMM|nr:MULTISPECIES: acetolactate synthase 2 small subunit [Pseudoalteromonas]ALU43345.1 acetolactate synthase [Pseudoalteromonas rubra]AZZ99713.1 acetolactate synthase 2 small subunit [Pseudoalteromonas sp. R3]KAF7788438.1 acetolactate synthase II small subunit [Pseudoalteromonas rubra]KJZ07114.1 acetolactate synthase [Pseudoalteromonas rubra]KNC67869.1 acetolactate synthase [Pseudoalteromonas rubra]
MKHQLTVAVNNQAIAVERFLRVARHRGFRLTQLELQGHEELFHVKMTVDSDKPIYLLTSQLNKLVEVQSVDLHTLQQAI